MTNEIFFFFQSRKANLSRMNLERNLYGLSRTSPDTAIINQFFEQNESNFEDLPYQQLNALRDNLTVGHRDDNSRMVSLYIKQNPFIEGNIKVIF